MAKVTTPASIAPDGQIVYGNGDGVTSSADLYWDATNKRLGIGTNTPDRHLDIEGTNPRARLLAGANEVAQLECADAAQIWRVGKATNDDFSVVDTTGSTTPFAIGAGSSSLAIKINSTGLGFFNTTPVAQAAHIADPTGGAFQDTEARNAIDAILVVLENLGFTATS